MREVVVRRPQDLGQIDPKIYVAKIAHTVGENKRLLILDEAERLGVRILNPGPKREVMGAVTRPAEEEKKETETAKPESEKDELKLQGEDN
jgi:hypothetical protein